MKIGVDVRPLQEGVTSGIGQYTYHLLTHLIPLNPSIEYHLFYNAFKYSHSLFSYFQFPNVRWHTFDFSNRALNAALILLGRPRLDMLVGGGIDVWFSPGWAYTSVSNRVKHVLVVHDISFAVDRSFFTFRRNLWHWLVRPKRMCRQAHTLIAVSHSTKNDLIDLYGVSPEKIKVVYEAVPPAREHTQRPKNISPQFLDKPYILYIGTIESRKNVTALVEAFTGVRAHHEVNLVIAGKLGWGYEPVLKAIAASPYKDSIFLEHDVDEEYKAYLYAHAGLFVFPSLYEGFGLPVLEAMSYGLPIVTSPNSSLLEVGGTAVMYIDPLNTHDIAVACEKILGDASFAQSLSKASRERAQKFSWEASARSTLEILTRCASV